MYSFPLMQLITLSSFYLCFHLKNMFLKIFFSMICIMLNRPQSLVVLKLLMEVATLWICAAYIEVSHSELGALLLQVSVCRLRGCPGPRPSSERGGLWDFYVRVSTEKHCLCGAASLSSKHTKSYVKLLNFLPKLIIFVGKFSFFWACVRLN